MLRTTAWTALAAAALLPLSASAQEPAAPGGGTAPSTLRIDLAARPFGTAEAKPVPSGSVVTDPAGERRVMAAGRDRPEIWKIDADGAVVDTGYFVSTGVAGRIRIEWENAPAAELREVSPGVPPWKPTGERFAAFRLSDWLVARDEPVGLPYFGREGIAFRFRPAGGLAASLKEGGEVAGSWWWSRGKLHLELEGFDDVAAYEWRALAAKVGWTQDTVAPVLVDPVRAGPVIVPSVPVSGSPPPPRRLPGAAVACPRDVLARLLGSAAERTDIVAALAIEKETLALCAERQALVVEIVKLDKALSDELEDEKTGGKPAGPARSVDQLAGTAPAAPAAPSAPVAVESKPPSPSPPQMARADDPPASPSRPVSAAPSPRFAWFSLLGRRGGLLAGVTDGSRSWFVSVGDELPGGRVVERISGKPPGVEVAGLGLLPWTGRPGTVAAAAAGAEAAALPGGDSAIDTAQASRPLEGRGRTLDGDTLDIAGVRVRLWGIDAPEKRQTCRADGRPWSCGGLAAAALRSRAIGLRCEGMEKDRYGRVLAVCYQGAEDVNAWMVSEGWALAYRRYSETYAPLEEEARKKGRGIHRGAFVPPWEWRRGKRLDEAAADRGTGTGREGEAGAGSETAPRSRPAEDGLPELPPPPATEGSG